MMNIDKKDGRTACCFAAVLMLALLVIPGGCGSSAYEDIRTGQTELREAGESSATYTKEQDAAEVSAQMEEAELCVYVCGAVRKSGVYVLPAGARVCEALEAAGGLLPEADETRINQAELLADAMQITVPLKGEPGSGPAVGDASESGRLNINTADAAALQTLSGIGASRAADSIAYRQMHGPFRTIEEIMKVSGIKIAIFERIREQICVG